MTATEVALALAGVLTALTAAPGCKASSPIRPVASSMPSIQVHVEVNDPLGDAVSDSRVPTSPDIVLAIVDVVGGDLAFRFRLASGTFASTTTRFAVDLDTDQDGSTGTTGVEYYVFIFPAGGRGADVARTTATSYTIVGIVPVTFVSDGCDVTVPLSWLGNEDGRFDFRVRVYAEPAIPLVLDVLPDAGFARVQ